MSNLGARLKAYRDGLGLSLKQVNNETKITNSRLSKIERGQIECPPKDLKKLAQLYNVQTISLFMEAGYLSEEDIVDYQFIFEGVSKLDDSEREHIQATIDFLNRKKGDKQ